MIVKRNPIDNYRKNPDLLVRPDGRLQGLYLQNGCGPYRKSFAINVSNFKRTTKLGISHTNFNQQYSRAIDKLVEFGNLTLTPEQRERFEQTREAFMKFYKIKVRVVEVIDFSDVK
jgi:hypothetical protein